MFSSAVHGVINTKPHLQHVADAELLMLLPEEAPRALQFLPAQHQLGACPPPGVKSAPNGGKF